MNRVEVSGRLVRDPEIRFLGKSRFPMLELNVAVDNAYGRWNRDTRSTEVEAGYYKVEVPGPYGEALHPQLTKGDEVYIVGSLSQWAFESRKTGETQRKTSIRAELVQPHKPLYFREGITAPDEPETDDYESIPF